MELTDTISDKMSDIFKPQRKFISVLLTTVMLIHGKVSFGNMSRYSSLCEKTFSGQSGNPSDSAGFDMIGTEMSVTPQTLMIAAADCSFTAESGRSRYRLQRFRMADAGPVRCRAYTHRSVRRAFRTGCSVSASLSTLSGC